MASSKKKNKGGKVKASAQLQAVVIPTYLEDWASSFSIASLPPPGMAVGVETRDLEPMYRIQQVVFRALTSPDFEMKRVLFQSNPKKEFKNLLEIYNQMRGWLDPANFIDVPPIHPGTTPTTRALILAYLVGGRCPTRVRQEMVRPDIKTIGDEELEMMLDIGRIILEEQLNARLGLPWLAEDDARGRFWEGNASNIGHYFGGVLGRAIATLGATTISPFINLPEEVTRGVGFVFAVTGRKLAEAAMHQELVNNPNDYPPPELTFEEGLED